jgi:hypothetical protein
MQLWAFARHASGSARVQEKKEYGETASLSYSGVSPSSGSSHLPPAGLLIAV